MGSVPKEFKEREHKFGFGGKENGDNIVWSVGLQVELSLQTTFLHAYTHTHTHIDLLPYFSIGFLT